MPTNQTIDGVLVPRELLYRVSDLYRPHGQEKTRAKLRALLDAPADVALPDRSPEDYAIEHAEYMAQSVDDVLARFQAYGLALLTADEGGDEGESELFEAIDTARSNLQESLVDLRGMIYEFRKRSNRCTSL